MTSTITTIFSAFSSFGFAIVSAWIVSERLVFNRHKGGKWLAEILDDISERIEVATGYRWLKRTVPKTLKTALSWSARAVRRASVPLRRMRATFGRSSASTGSPDGVEPAPLPHASPTIVPDAVIVTPRSGSTSPTKLAVQFQLSRGGERNSGEAGRRSPDASPIISPVTLSSTPDLGTEVSATRVRFRNIVYSVIKMNRLIGVADEAKAKVSRSLIDGKPIDWKLAETTVKPRNSRVAKMVSRLQNITPTQDIAAHAALVRHMQVSVEPMVMFVPGAKGLSQFSPDGKFLATASWDRTSLIFHVGVCCIHAFSPCVPERLDRGN